MDKITKDEMIEILLKQFNEEDMECPVLLDARTHGWDFALTEATQNAVIWLFDIVQELLERQLRGETIPVPKVRTMLRNMNFLRSDIFYDSAYNNWNPVDMERKQ